MDKNMSFAKHLIFVSGALITGICLLGMSGTDGSLSPQGITALISVSSTVARSSVRKGPDATMLVNRYGKEFPNFIEGKLKRAYRHPDWADWFCWFTGRKFDRAGLVYFKRIFENPHWKPNVTLHNLQNTEALQVFLDEALGVQSEDEFREALHRANTRVLNKTPDTSTQQIIALMNTKKSDGSYEVEDQEYYKSVESILFMAFLYEECKKNLEKYMNWK